MIKNLTPHVINIMGDNGNIIATFNPEPTPARCTQETVRVGKVDDIPITCSVFGEVTNLPEKQDGVFLIVSQLVANACPDRTDLLITNEAVRDDAGRIIGCRSLGTVADIFDVT